MAENRRGEAWADFRDRHGDWGRELLFHPARGRSGLTSRKFGAALGVMEYKTVVKAVQRFTTALSHGAAKRRLARAYLNGLPLLET